MLKDYKRHDFQTIELKITTQAARSLHYGHDQKALRLVKTSNGDCHHTVQAIRQAT